MYRTGTGGIYYRCFGRAVNYDQGCGAPMIRVAELDSLVLNSSGGWDSEAHISRRVVAGNDAGVRLQQLRDEMAEEMRTAAPDVLPKIAVAYAERIAALEAEGSVEPHWIDERSGMTEGEYMLTLDLDGRREYLARKDIRAWKVGPAGHLSHRGRASVPQGRAIHDRGLAGLTATCSSWKSIRSEGVPTWTLSRLRELSRSRTSAS